MPKGHALAAGDEIHPLSLDVAVTPPVHPQTGRKVFCFTTVTENDPAAGPGVRPPGHGH